MKPVPLKYDAPWFSSVKTEHLITNNIRWEWLCCVRPNNIILYNMNNFISKNLEENLWRS